MFAALFVMTLGVSVTSCRVLVFIGGVIISASYVITAMVDDICWLLLSYGVLLGKCDVMPRVGVHWRRDYLCILRDHRHGGRHLLAAALV